MGWGDRTANSGFKATGGRRSYNLRRQSIAGRRRVLLAQMIGKVSQAEAARMLGVSEATISRDVARLNVANHTTSQEGHRASPTIIP